MKKKIAILLILILIISLTACSMITEGTIINKEFTPAHTDLFPMIVSTGKVTTCTIIPIFRDDKWTVTIEKAEKTATWEVTEKDYNRLKIGDYLKIENGE